MMTDIFKDIDIAVRGELDRIDTKELAFHSDHEAWAILLEEIEEAQDEIEQLNSAMKELKSLVFCDDASRFKLEMLGNMQYNSRAALAELVQVAAVIDKFFNKVKGDN